MILFPAIDILQGRCVRLLHGDYHKVTDYGDPLQAALRWEREGAAYLHIVDLDAAKSGRGENTELIGEIARRVRIPVQTGGGVRTLQDVQTRLSVGVARVILGTACCEDPETLRAAVKEWGAERIVCGIDAKNGAVATRGWLAQSDVSPLSLGKEMYACGVRYAVYTDIGKDGTLGGVNVQACCEMAQATGLKVIASGGVGSLHDIAALRAAQMYGAILGKALYANSFSLSDALGLAEEKENGRKI